MKLAIIKMTALPINDFFGHFSPEL